MVWRQIGNAAQSQVGVVRCSSSEWDSGSASPSCCCRRTSASRRASTARRSQPSSASRPSVDRNGQACAVGSELWATFVKKAEFGARMAIDLVRSSGRKDDEAASPRPPSECPPQMSRASPSPGCTGTLTPPDQVPAAVRGNADGPLDSDTGERKPARDNAEGPAEPRPRPSPPPGRVAASLRASDARTSGHVSEGRSVRSPGQYLARRMTATPLASPPLQDHMHRGGRASGAPCRRIGSCAAHDARRHPLRFRAPRRLGGPLPLRDRAGTRACRRFPDALRTEANKVRGCASQVWLATSVPRASPTSAPLLEFQGDSDAHIVRGLIAILFATSVRGQDRRRDPAHRRTRSVRGAGPEGAPHPAALERVLLDGGAHPPRCPRARCRRLTSVCVAAPADRASPTAAMPPEPKNGRRQEVEVADCEHCTGPY